MNTLLEQRIIYEWQHAIRLSSEEKNNRSWWDVYNVLYGVSLCIEPEDKDDIALLMNMARDLYFINATPMYWKTYMQKRQI